MSLPPLFPFQGDWHQYEDAIYQIYLNTFVKAKITFQGLPVTARYVPATRDKGFSFWHVISEGNKEEDRVPDLKRCERIAWIAWLIQNVGTHPDLCCWESERKGNVHTVIWYEKESYAVVLAKRDGYFVLKTAYWVKRDREGDFRRERDEYRRTHKG